MSQTDVRTFKAATMQQALDLVRKEMGADAVILHTRELPQPKFLRWKRSDEKVEITAGTGVNVRTPRAVLQAGSSSSSAANRLAGQSRPDKELAPPPQLLPEVRRMSEPPVSAPVETMNRLSPRPSSPPPNSPVATSSPANPPVSNGQLQQQAAIARQLSSIQKMVETLTRNAVSQGEEIHSELFHLYTDLIDAEVDEELARDLVCRLKSEVPADQLGNATATKKRLCDMVEAEIKCTKPIAVTSGKRRVVALVGPTGVGKTTTIAKLAANFRLRDGIRMGLVTVDTYRIAAVEQLRTYAEIIDLPMKVVTGPREMRRALDELMGLDLVLIDTAGRSPRDELKIQELKSLLAEAEVDEVHLVQSLVASTKSLEATAEKFAAAGTTAMILTKLDEAVGMGTLMSVARKIPLPISYLTTGQNVPDDIEPAQARRMARLVLGEDSLGSKR